MLQYRMENKVFYLLYFFYITCKFYTTYLQYFIKVYCYLYSKLCVYSLSKNFELKNYFSVILPVYNKAKSSTL
jgi:hypothetical protein